MILPQHQMEMAENSAKVSQLFGMCSALRSQGKNPVDLTLGNPLEKPLPAFYEALHEVAAELEREPDNPHRYMPNPGYLATREVMAQALSKRAQLDLKASDIWMIAGCANGLDVCLASLLAPGQEVIMLTPGFMEYARYIEQNQGIVRMVRSSTDWGIDHSALVAAINDQTQVLLLNFPNNPTGRVLEESELAALAETLTQIEKRRGKPILVLEDSPYDQLVFEDHLPSCLMRFYRHSIYMTSFSKSHGLAGERLGYMALHPEWGTPTERAMLETILTNNLRCRVINAPGIMQRVVARIGPAACVDLKGCEKRLRRLESALLKAGFRLKPAKGGFYIFAQLPPSISWEKWTDWALASDEPILSVPGPFFGGSNYADHVRFAVTVPEADIERACRRLENWDHDERSSYV